MPPTPIKTWITASDFFSGRIAEKAKIDTILVGDSLGMTVYGHNDTTQVTKEVMARHFEAVKKGAPNSRIVIDFPYGCDTNVLDAVETAEFFSNYGATIFKIEGGIEMLEIFLELRSRGYEIVGHLGLTPQKTKKRHWKLQGNTKESAEDIRNTCKKFEAIGIQEMVLECVPEQLAKAIQEKFFGDIIGIGAGRFTNAQVLVFDDVIGRSGEKFFPKFLQKFGNAEVENLNAVQKFKQSVEEKKFPAEKNCFL